MSGFLGAWQPLFDLFLLNCGFAFGQYVVLRAGVFSIANAGLASLGAYAAGLLVKEQGWGLIPGAAAGILVGTLAAVLLALPLARLRGVYQAIATLAFVQIVLALGLWAEDFTGGAMGLNSIPKLVTTVELLLALALVIYLVSALGATRLGRAFDAMRQDEAVAATLGIEVSRHHLIAFALSGAIAGLFGALYALYAYSIEPNQFGFPFLVSILAMVVLGGRRSLAGPLVGAAILTALPEVARPLAENRTLLHGILLIAVICFLPQGIADSCGAAWRRRRLRRGLP